MISIVRPSQHCHRFTRRRFLAGSAAAGAGLLSWNAAIGLSAAAGPTDPDRWTLVSDIHLSHNRQAKNRGVAPAEGLAQAREGSLALEPRPAGVIVCGDCAFNEGLSPDYALLAEMIQPWQQAKVAVHFALGNHDHRENFWHALAAMKPSGPAAVDGKHAYAIESLRVRWIILDSLEKTKQTPGLLGKEQLAWLAAQLDAHPEKPAMVVAHHHPDPTGRLNGLKDTGPLLEILTSRKQAKALVFGHTHRWQHVEIGGLHYLNVPATAWIFDADQPRAWLDVHLRDDGAQVALCCLDKSHKANGQQVDMKWR